MKNRVKELREVKGITQEDLARKAGVARTVISQLETESRKAITSETMLKLAEALEKPVKDIFLF